MIKVSALRRIISVIVITAMCTGFFAGLPAAAQAYGGYVDQFNYYADSALAGGLVPTSVQGDLDEILTGGDLIDFIFQFSKVKSGIDVDSFLSRARAISSSEDAAKVSAINEMFSYNVWDVNTDGALGDRVRLSVIFGTFQFAVYKQIAPFSPLLYYLNDPIPVLNRYNFQNIPHVVYHDEVMLGLFSEIMGLSKGIPYTPVKPADNMTRRQFAAFCYMFSTMSLSRDMSGKYPGGVSGDRAVDDFITGILDSAIKPGMSDNQRVKAIYDYLIYNFRHDDDTMPIIIGSFDTSINPLNDTIRLASPMILSGKGTCDVFANVFRLLAIRLGYECNYVSGQYVNSNGSRSGHGWNQIKVNDEWFWVDVDVEGQVFHRGNAAAPSYFLFMKKDSNWTSNHDWARADWPAVDETKYPLELSDLDGEIPPFPPVTQAQATAQTTAQEQSAATQIPAANEIKVFFNGKALVFDVPPQNMSGRILVPLRAIFEEMGAVIAYDGASQTVIATTADTVVVLTIGDTSPTVNGLVVPLDQAGIIVDGRSLAPLRFVAEAFGGSVEWNGDTQTATITK